MIKLLQWTAIFIIFIIIPRLHAQNLTKEEVYDAIKEMPSFSIYKDNYFITGIPLNKDINKNTTDLKYQISIYPKSFLECL